MISGWPSAQKCPKTPAKPSSGYAGRTASCSNWTRRHGPRQTSGAQPTTPRAQFHAHLWPLATFGCRLSGGDPHSQRHTPRNQLRWPIRIAMSDRRYTSCPHKPRHKGWRKAARAIDTIYARNDGPAALRLSHRPSESRVRPRTAPACRHFLAHLCERRTTGRQCANRAAR